MKYYVKVKKESDSMSLDLWNKYYLYQKRFFWFDKLIYSSYDSNSIKNRLEEILYIENLVKNIQQEDYLKNNP